MIDIQHDIKFFLKDPNFKISLNTRVRILCEIYSLKEDKNIEPWMMKTLNNALWFNYNEIADEVNVLIFKNSVIESNPVQLELFHGFKDNEINIATVHKNIIYSITKNLENESKNKSILQEISSKNDNILCSQNEICKDNNDDISYQYSTPIANKDIVEHPIKKKRRRSGEF